MPPDMKSLTHFSFVLREKYKQCPPMKTNRA
ncbi:unnamed protein product [Nippostrongylus brasiliensis]|uniref:Uncharacterized protein n=1 Tax=Nippostrongylus brasiliensis TaxID=27835 RepID=A0A0N4XJ56_NIPBR|nr:unnamed protein product [Nippostrongylus brasiliensis]